MTQQHSIIIAIAILAIGTYAIRYMGYSIGAHFSLSQKQQYLLNTAATTLLFSIAVMTSLFEGQHFAGFARLFGVLMALFLIWRGYSLLLVLIFAALSTAVLRYMGIA